MAVLGLHALVGRILAMTRALPGRLLVVGKPLREVHELKPIAVSNSEHSTRRPLPVRWGSYSAARMPCTAHMLVSRLIKEAHRRPDVRCAKLAAGEGETSPGQQS